MHFFDSLVRNPLAKRVKSIFSAELRLNQDTPVYIVIPWRIVVTNTSTQTTTIVGAYVPQIETIFKVMHLPPFGLEDDEVYIDDNLAAYIDFPKLLAPGDSLIGYVMGMLRLGGSKSDIKAFVHASTVDDVHKITQKLGRDIFGDSVVNVGDVGYKLSDNAVGKMTADRADRRSPPYESLIYSIDTTVRTARGRLFVSTCRPFY